MKEKKAVASKIKEEMSKSSKLRVLSHDRSLSFDKATELREKQSEAYKKVEFFKNLNKAMK